MTQATMNIRIDENVKKSFDEFCAETGLNASVAVNMFVRAVLRSRKIPFEITDTVTPKADERQVANALVETLLSRIEEKETTTQWIEHESVINDARAIVDNVRNI